MVHTVLKQIEGSACIHIEGISKAPYRAKKNSREYLWHDTHYLSFKKCKKEKKVQENGISAK